MEIRIHNIWRVFQRKVESIYEDVFLQRCKYSQFPGTKFPVREAKQKNGLASSGLKVQNVD